MDPHEQHGHHDQLHGPHAAHGPMRRVLPGILTVVLIDFLTAFGFYTTVIFMPMYFQVCVHACSVLQRAYNAPFHPCASASYKCML